jgi:hypothetical protein
MVRIKEVSKVFVWVVSTMSWGCCFLFICGFRPTHDRDHFQLPWPRATKTSFTKAQLVTSYSMTSSIAPDSRLVPTSTENLLLLEVAILHTWQLRLLRYPICSDRGYQSLSVYQCIPVSPISPSENTVCLGHLPSAAGVPASVRAAPVPSTAVLSTTFTKET